MKKISDLEDHVGYWLRVVSNHVHTAFAAKLFDSGVTVAEWIILRHIFENEDASQTALVNATGLTKGAISKLIDRLDKKRLIVLNIAGGDGRAHQIGLSKKGKRLLPTIAALADANDHEFFECLGQAERKSLIGLLRRVVIRKGLRQSAIR